jgi:hypothetical protein
VNIPANQCEGIKERLERQLNSEVNSLHGNKDTVVEATVLQLVKKFTIFRGTQRVITMFKRVCQWSPILQKQSTPIPHLCQYFITNVVAQDSAKFKDLKHVGFLGREFHSP